jgi:hypothetical protein
MFLLKSDAGGCGMGWQRVKKRRIKNEEVRRIKNEEVRIKNEEVQN